jgi:transposase InsO family protein
LEEALSKGKPEVFNTDQGSQFTSDGFTALLVSHGVRISMDGKGRYMDNIFVERLWRTVKYEEVYLRPTPADGRPRPGSTPTSASTTPSGPIRPSVTGHQPRYSTKIRRHQRTT